MRISDWSSDVCSADLFREVLPGGVRRDEDFLRHGAPAPALTLWRAPLPDDVDSKGKPKPWSAGRSRELATQACVAAIHRVLCDARDGHRSEEHTSELQSLMRNSYAVFCLKTKITHLH